MLKFYVGKVLSGELSCPCDRSCFSYFSLKPYVMTPHLNRLNETVQMRGYNICFYAELKNYPLLSPNTTSCLEFCVFRGKQKVNKQ